MTTRSDLFTEFKHFLKQAVVFLSRFGALSVTVAIIVGGISSIYYLYYDETGTYRESSDIGFELFEFIVPIAIATALSSILSVWFYHVLAIRRELESVRAVLDHHQKQPRAYYALGFGTLIAFLTIWITGQINGTPVHELILINPGGLFAIITGVFSLVALYFAVSGILDIRNTITSFAEYIARFEALYDSTAPDDVIYICVHTPATGCLALPDHIWRALTRRLNSGDKNFALICLSQDEMFEWFKSFLLEFEGNEVRIREMKRRIREGINASETIKRQALSNENCDDVKWHDGKEAPKLMGVTWDTLPGTYFVANRRRAIIASPFFLPRRGQKESIGTFSERVEIIGLETQDMGVVSSVHKEIFRIRSYIEQRGGVRETDQKSITEASKLLSEFEEGC